MNIVLWVIAGLVSAAFLFSGTYKLVLSRENYVAAQPWAADAPHWAPNVIGGLELLGAVGIIVPAVLDIAPVLVPAAGTGLAVVMVGAVVMHLRRRECAALVPSGVLLVLALSVAWGRFGPYEF
jgi:uncharacterized membrane protein